MFFRAFKVHFHIQLGMDNIALSVADSPVDGSESILEIQLIKCKILYHENKNRITYFLRLQLNRQTSGFCTRTIIFIEGPPALITIVRVSYARDTLHDSNIIQIY